MGGLAYQACFYELYLRAKSIQILNVRIKQNVMNAQRIQYSGPCAPAYAPRRSIRVREGWLAPASFNRQYCTPAVQTRYV